MYNDIIFTGVFPGGVEELSVFFIPKANSNKVRLICMSFCFLKLLEKIINESFCWWIEHNKLINNSQFEFRMNKSCIDSLALLVSEIEIQFYKKSYLAATFLVDLR